MSNTTDLNWVRSRFSNAGTHPRCVEVAESGEQIHFRESDEPTEQIITSRDEAITFRDAIKAGRVFGDVGGFNVIGDDLVVAIQLGDQKIQTSASNYAIFVAGVVAGDLDYIEAIASATA